MSKQKPACTQRTYEVTMAKIHKTPLSCPMDDMPLALAHPKVFLPIMKTGKAICPYCSAQFILTDFKAGNASDLTDTESE